jgi:ferritin
MLDKKVSDLLINQLNKELYSSYIYLDIANYYEKEGLSGFANWFYIQMQEELDHAMLFRKYLLDNDVEIVLSRVEKPAYSYNTLIDPLKSTVRHEEAVTSLINAIYTAALNASDYRTEKFINWFISEQLQEERDAKALVRKFELFASDGKGLYELDKDLGARVYTPTVVED